MHLRLYAALAAGAAALPAASLTAHAAPSTPPQPATATFQAVTIPTGSEAGWTFTLVGPGTPAGGEKLVTTGTAPTAFATPLQAGFYTIAETTLTGWDQTASTGCAFTVAYPADDGHTFACSVADTHEGRVTVTATHGGQAPSGTDSFPFVLSGGPDNVLGTQVAVAANHGTLDFGLFRPGSYTLCQQAPPSGWSTSLVTQGGLPNAGGDICLPFTLAPGQTKAFTVDNTSPAVSTPTPTPTPTPTASPTPTPKPTPAPTPRGAVQGVTAIGPPSTGGGIPTPNTGVGLSGLAGLPLLLLGGALVARGRRRR